MYPEIEKVSIDSKLPQTFSSRLFNWIISGQSDLNYHYMVERVGQDYESFLGRPLDRLCIYKDIPDQINSRAIHIGMIGKYDKQIPTPRFYLQIAYRIIIPNMHLFGIPYGNIYFHNDLSEKHKECPGLFFKKSLFMSKLKSLPIR